MEFLARARRRAVVEAMGVMRRFFLALLLLLAFAAIALPPLWFRLFREPAPELPPPGRRVALAGGVGVNVVEEGAGPAVVLVHGLPGSAYDWRQHERGARASAAGARSPTTASATAGPIRARTTAFSRRVERRASCSGCSTRSGSKTSTVVGWSYGGATAIAAAQRDPSRMARVVLVGSAGPGMEVCAAAARARRAS